MASSRSTGVLSADTLVFNGRQRINALTVFTDSTNPATVEIRDGLNTGAPVKVKGVCAGTALAAHYIFENPVILEDGLFVDITGTGASCIVYYGG